MQERRNIQRWSLLLFLPIYDRDSQQVLGHVADITHEGLMVFSQQAIELGCDFNLEIQVDDLKEALLFQPGDAEENIHLTARSRWIAPNPGLNRTGFMFINLSPKAEAAIARIVEHVQHNFNLS